MDVTQQNFQSAVIERSHEVPVVVDFWAEWCGPCRQLGPVLEQAVAKREGKVELAKLDTDANQELARAFQIQGIPAVKAFKDGEVVAEFVGAQPPQAVERFLDSLVPSEAELLAQQGDEVSLRKALEIEPSRADAAVPLARILHARGDLDEALEILERVPNNFAAEGLQARIELERGSDPALPNLQEALTALDAGEHERALDLLIGDLPTADGAKDDLRKLIVGILDDLGPASELARAARRRLAAALY